MAIDLEEAQAQLADLVKGTYSVNDLLDLVGKVDISASGEITVLQR